MPTITLLHSFCVSKTALADHQEILTFNWTFSNPAIRVPIANNGVYYKNQDAVRRGHRSLPLIGASEWIVGASLQCRTESDKIKLLKILKVLERHFRSETANDFITVIRSDDKQRFPDGISSSQSYNGVTNTLGFTQDQLTALCKVLGCDLSWSSLSGGQDDQVKAAEALIRAIAASQQVTLV